MSKLKSTENISTMQSIFAQHLQQLKNVINKSATQKNAGLFLYKNDARTILFKLEALSRMFKNFHNKKRFTKMLEKFKMLEDAIGQIDYYTSLAEKAGQSANDAKVKKHSTQQALHHASVLHAHILENWVGAKSSFIKMEEKLATAKWQDEANLDASIKTFYTEEIKKVSELISNSTFANIETDVHEIRRKLRWLSIYPHAVQGKIQLLKDANAKLAYKPYLTKSVLSSPFNKMPVKGAHKTIVQLYAPAFYALSFVIAELGDLKDNGLTQHGYTNALVNADKISPSQAKLDTAKTLGTTAKKESAILLEAKTTCEKFMKLGALKALLVSK